MKNDSQLVGDLVRIYRRGSKWYANYQQAGRQVRESLRTHSKKEALRLAQQIDARLQAGTHRRPQRIATITEAIEEYMQWLKAEGRADKTLGKYRHCFKLMEELAKGRQTTRLDQLDQRFLDAFRRERFDAGGKPKTVHNDTVTIRQLVNFALRRRLVADDPLRGLKLSRPKPTPQPWWTRPQVEQILAACRGPYQESLRVLAETGMRVGELRWLTWCDVDLDQKVIHIRPKEGWKPKTGDQRVIPMSPALVAFFSASPRRGRWVFTAPVTPQHPQPDRQVSDRRLLEYLKRRLKRLGLPGHLHTFRHSFISHALMSGTAVAVVLSWVGHVDVETLKLYTHIADEFSKAAMQRLSEPKHNSLHANQKDSENDQADQPNSAQI